MPFQRKQFALANCIQKSGFDGVVCHRQIDKGNRLVFTVTWRCRVYQIILREAAPALKEHPVQQQTNTPAPAFQTSPPTTRGAETRNGCEVLCATSPRAPELVFPRVRGKGETLCIKPRSSGSTRRAGPRGTGRTVRAASAPLLRPSPPAARAGSPAFPPPGAGAPGYLSSSASALPPRPRNRGGHSTAFWGGPGAPSRSAEHVLPRVNPPEQQS